MWRERGGHWGERERERERERLHRKLRQDSQRGSEWTEMNLAKDEFGCSLLVFWKQGTRGVSVKIIASG